MEWIKGLLSQFADWLWGMVKDAALWAFGGIMDAIGELLHKVPVPAWASDLGSNWANLSGQVGYWLEPFQVGTGVTIILSAYGIRFLIRRLPIVG